MANEFSYTIIIPKTSCSDPSAMCVWAEENDIPCTWKTMHSGNAFGRAVITGFAFCFNDEDAATAFKLRWL